MTKKKEKIEKGVFDIPAIHAEGYKTISYSAVNGHHVETRFYAAGDIVELIVNNKIVSRHALPLEGDAEVLEIENPNAL